MKRLLASLLFLAPTLNAQQVATTTTPSLVPGEIYTTGNIVQPTVTGGGSTWVGAVYQDQLTCWAGGDPGYCGPSAIVRPGNVLNFSYGSTYVYQQQHITTLLPSATGLQVNGYNFGFMAKNGNGWDDGRTDQLTALVRFWDNTNGKSANNLLYGTSYNLNYKFDWTQFNYSETFTKPLAATDIGLVQYGFIGQDNNFWAGPYGPELYNISFSLKYSVDPCIKDPLYSPTCPGYLDALNKLLSPTTTIATDPISSTTTSAGTTTTIVTDPVASTVNVSSSTNIGQPSIVASVVSAPAPSTSSTSSTTIQSTKETTQSSGNSVSLALSVISKNSERDAISSAVAQTAVSQAQSVATQAQQEAQSIAASSVANSTTTNSASGSQQSSGTGIRVNNSNSTNFTLQSGMTSLASTVMGPQTTNNMIVQQQNSSTTGLNLSNNQLITTLNVGSAQSSNSSTTTFALPLLQPQQPTLVVPNSTSIQVETQSQQVASIKSLTTSTTETTSILSPNFLTDRSNPLTDIVEGKNTVPQNSTIATSVSSVNKNAQDNEVAGGVDLNKMALAPIGYSGYLNFTLRDASFYAPKEVYKDQRNVDNARALRLLTNDSKHKEMVEMQYVR